MFSLGLCSVMLHLQRLSHYVCLQKHEETQSSATRSGRACSAATQLRCCIIACSAATAFRGNAKLPLPTAQAHKAKDWAERIGDLLLDAVDAVAAAAHAAVAAILVSTLANAATPGAARRAFVST